MGLDKDFLSLLEGSAAWSASTGEDAFGNAAYASPVTIQAYIPEVVERTGQQDGQGKQDDLKVYQAELTTDAVGVKIGDKLEFAGHVMWATGVSTPNDEFGVPLYHQIQANTAQRG